MPSFLCLFFFYWRKKLIKPNLKTALNDDIDQHLDLDRHALLLMAHPCPSSWTLPFLSSAPSQEATSEIQSDPEETMFTKLNLFYLVPATLPQQRWPKTSRSRLCNAHLKKNNNNLAQRVPLCFL
uniref:Uncharacterized protein n=1 Tax=Anguilla anguilla TaxID=7936 RepID=A0A0E9X9U2_ANGAN